MKRRRDANAWPSLRRVLPSPLLPPLHLLLLLLLPLIHCQLAVPDASSMCRITRLGPYRVTDSRGYLCARTDLDPATQCCPTSASDQYTCSECDPNGCCQDFTACVSCCLSPEHDMAALLPSVPRIRAHPELGYFSDTFDLCTALCRHSSVSTMHENEYISPTHHCYLADARPWEAHEVAGGDLPTGVEVIAGDQGQSCTEACASKNRKCSTRSDVRDVVNSCHQLRALFPCEAGCQENVNRETLPGYTVYGVEKKLWPALCRIGGEGGWGCDASEKTLQRLCVCE